MPKGLKKGLVIFGFSLLGLVALILLAVIVFIACEPLIYANYYGRARQEFMLPGISDNFVQQGLTYTENDGERIFLSSGYMSDKTASRIYRTGADGVSRHVTLCYADGTAYRGHAGGVSAYGAYTYVCDSEAEQPQVLVFETAALLHAAEASAVSAIGSFPVGTNASFCHADDGVLYVGEFYLSPAYKTDPSHHLTTPSGEEHHALVFGYALSPDAPLGLASGDPVRAYSVPDKVQGMCTTESGRIVLSTSFALASSHNYVYAEPAAEAPDVFEYAEGKTVPLWYLDQSTREEDVRQPPMSEEIVCADGRVYVIGESASNKYFFGKLLRTKFVWSYTVA